MAVRGTPASSLQGNALGGVLRDLSRRTRSTTKRGGAGKGAQGERGEQGKPGPRGPAGKDGTTVHAALVHTDGDGRAVLTLPEVEEGQELILSALATAPDGDALAWVVLESMCPELAVLRVWAARPLDGPVSAVPVGAGVAVHVTAVPAGS
jgi:hypothetical protein